MYVFTQQMERSKSWSFKSKSIFQFPPFAEFLTKTGIDRH